MFEIKKSTIDNAGQGLFSTKFIPMGTILEIAHSKPSFRSINNEKEVLSFFIDRYPDDLALCIEDKTIKKTSDIVEDCSKYNFRKRFVFASKDKPLMKANDFAYVKGVSEIEYKERMHMNHLDIIHEIVDGKIKSVKLYFVKNVHEHQEIGLSYGFSYWSDVAISTRNRRQNNELPNKKI